MDAACAGMPFYTSGPSIEGNDTGETATLIRHKLGHFATFNLSRLRSPSRPCGHARMAVLDVVTDNL